MPPMTIAASPETAAEIPFICVPICAVAAAKAMDSSYVPLSRRTSDQLLASADELRRMATTATTADVMNALLTLADRYAALAKNRQAEESNLADTQP